MKNIFVGNLSFNTSEDELRQMFEPFGQVDRVSIMTDRDTGRSRGFGFVEMASNEDGEKAITALNGTQVGGRTLNVNEARPKTEHAGGGGRDRGGRGGDRGGTVVAAAVAGAAAKNPQFRQSSSDRILAIVDVRLRASAMASNCASDHSGPQCANGLASARPIDCTAPLMLLSPPM